MKSADLLMTFLILCRSTPGSGLPSFTCSGNRCFGIGYYFASTVKVIVDIRGTNLGECSNFCGMNDRKHDAAAFDRSLVSASRTPSSLNYFLATVHLLGHPNGRATSWVKGLSWKVNWYKLEFTWVFKSIHRPEWVSYRDAFPLKSPLHT